jgi:hypothetical protein
MSAYVGQVEKGDGRRAQAVDRTTLGRVCQGCPPEQRDGEVSAAFPQQELWDPS